MKAKLLYFICTSGYAAIGILGMVGNAYIEKDGPGRMFSNYYMAILPVTLLVGILSSYHHRRLFYPDYIKSNTLKKTLVIIIFLIGSFVFTSGNFLFVNSSFGKRSPIILRGFIERKWLEEKKRDNDYFIGIRDTVTGSYYEFEVKKRVYDRIGETGDGIVKSFYKGSLGVMYRHTY